MSGFIKSDTTDGQWLSPVPTERKWQEEKLVELFFHYPNASPRWQYMNGLIHLGLELMELRKIIPEYNLGDKVTTDYYNHGEVFEVVGIRKDQLELKGDWSGGTHSSIGNAWYPIEKCRLKEPGWIKIGDNSEDI
jgi:hypothetical protein